MIITHPFDLEPVWVVYAFSAELQEFVPAAIYTEEHDALSFILCHPEFHLSTPVRHSFTFVIDELVTTRLASLGLTLKIQKAMS